jgi:phosphatidate cytidylyltransferase
VTDDTRGSLARAIAPPEAPAGEAPKKRSSWGLPLRVASGLLFVPILILLAHAGGLAFLALIAAQVTIGLMEFYGMMRRRGLRPYRRLGIAASLALLWACYQIRVPYAAFLATAGLMLVLALELRRPEARQRVEDIAVTFFGVLYVGWLSAHLVLLRQLPWRAGTSYADGAAFVLLAFFVTWSCDTGAYAVGRLFGRNRPWVHISPRKTLEGSLAGLLLAIVAAFIARAWFAPFLAVRDAAAIGFLVGVFAQVGDLVESLLKRDTLHGDSSDLIPGHGGVLDRFDSLFFAAPAVYYYLAYLVFGVPQ